MSVIPTNGAAVNGAATSTPIPPPVTLAPASYDPWNNLVAKAIDLETVAKILGPVIRTDAIRLPCACIDGSCPRCTLTRIIAENQPTDAWTVYEAEEEYIGMRKLGYISARTADEAKEVARRQLPYRGRLIVRLKRDEDEAARRQAEHDAEGW